MEYNSIFYNVWKGWVLRAFFRSGGVGVFVGDADGAVEEAAGPSPTGRAAATRSTGENDLVADRPR